LPAVKVGLNSDTTKYRERNSESFTSARAVERPYDVPLLPKLFSRFNAIYHK
jgi:hypothetical protein